MKTNISNTPEGQRVMLSFERRLRVANRSEQTIRNYVRGIRALMNFHDSLPDELEIDQVIDFLNDLQVEKLRNWRTIKIYVAALRWYYQHMVNQIDLAMQIPYPKEKPSLPQVLSREELTRLFDACLNPKHRVMFRLLYSSGLRRGEILRLTTDDLITKDGKLHILRHCFASHALEEGINLENTAISIGTQHSANHHGISARQ
jgi:site-specific recombinase XerD